MNKRTKTGLAIMFLFTSLLFLTSCPPYTQCDEPEVRSELVPDSIIDMFPHHGVNSLRYLHSGGHIISFRIETDTIHDVHWFDKCNQTKESYFVAEFTPNHPAIRMGLSIRSWSDKLFPFRIIIGSRSAEFVVGRPDNLQALRTDSMHLNGLLWRDVMRVRLTSDSFFAPTAGAVYPDSLYFSFEHGIIRVIMTNNETYTLLP
ncbi:MAG TPA: hypothetical protein VLH37_06175 [Bacteroidales bacterium]|nr:hypothetical protein [Bacteroidales bacterium]